MSFTQLERSRLLMLREQALSHSIETQEWPSEHLEELLAGCIETPGPFRGCYRLPGSQSVAVHATELNVQSPGKALTTFEGDLRKFSMLPNCPHLLAPTLSWLVFAEQPGASMRVFFMQAFPYTPKTLASMIQEFDGDREHGSTTRRVADILRTMLPVALAVDALQCAGLVHMGICPEEVLLYPDGAVRLAGAERAQRIGTSVHVGSYEHMSDNQPLMCPSDMLWSRFMRAHPAQDSWSVGMLMWQLALGSDTHPLIPRPVLARLHSMGVANDRSTIAAHGASGTRWPDEALKLPAPLLNALRGLLHPRQEPRWRMSRLLRSGLFPPRAGLQVSPADGYRNILLPTPSSFTSSTPVAKATKPTTSLESDQANNTFDHIGAVGTVQEATSTPPPCVPPPSSNAPASPTDATSPKASPKSTDDYHAISFDDFLLPVDLDDDFGPADATVRVQAAPRTGAMCWAIPFEPRQSIGGSEGSVGSVCSVRSATSSCGSAGSWAGLADMATYLNSLVAAPAEGLISAPTPLVPASRVGRVAFGLGSSAEQRKRHSSRKQGSSGRLPWEVSDSSDDETSPAAGSREPGGNAAGRSAFLSKRGGVRITHHSAHAAHSPLAVSVMTRAGNRMQAALDEEARAARAAELAEALAAAKAAAAAAAAKAAADLAAANAARAGSGTRDRKVATGSGAKAGEKAASRSAPPPPPPPSYAEAVSGTSVRVVAAAPADGNLSDNLLAGWVAPGSSAPEPVRRVGRGTMGGAPPAVSQPAADEFEDVPLTGPEPGAADAGSQSEVAASGLGSAAGQHASSGPLLPTPAPKAPRPSAQQARGHAMTFGQLMRAVLMGWPVADVKGGRGPWSSRGPPPGFGMLPRHAVAATAVATAAGGMASSTAAGGGVGSLPVDPATAAWVDQAAVAAEADALLAAGKRPALNPAAAPFAPALARASTSLPAAPVPQTCSEEEVDDDSDVHMDAAAARLLAAAHPTPCSSIPSPLPHVAPAGAAVTAGPVMTAAMDDNLGAEASFVDGFFSDATSDSDEEMIPPLNLELAGAGPAGNVSGCVHVSGLCGDVNGPEGDAVVMLEVSRCEERKGLSLCASVAADACSRSAFRLAISVGSVGAGGEEGVGVVVTEGVMTSPKELCPVLSPRQRRPSDDALDTRDQSEGCGQAAAAATAAVAAPDGVSLEMSAGAVAHGVPLHVAAAGLVVA